MTSETNANADNLDKREEKSPKSWKCCACLSGCVVPLILFILVVVAMTWNGFEEVENGSIPDILHELAGEWVVEEPGFFPIGIGSDIGNWQETKLVLNDDGTCEFHNLTLYMTSPDFPDRRNPELAGKILTGVWESIPQHVSYSDGSNNVYATILVTVYATDETVPEHDSMDVFLGFPKAKDAEKKVSVPLGLCKVRGSEKDYRLYWIPPDPDMGRGGVFMKRVSL